MLKPRYSDEKYLCKYDLSVELFDELGVDIIELWPIRNIFILNTKQGKKILKMIDYDEDRLNFICDSLEYIGKEYENILKINTLPNHKKFLNWKEEKYILLDLIEGIEFNISNPIELQKTTEGIAKLHNASRDFILSSDVEKNKYSNLNKLKNQFEESVANLSAFKIQVNKYKYKNEFDTLFLQVVDSKIKEIKNCINLLEKSDYENMCINKNYITICHNDLAYHNIIFSNNEPNFIDFDFCSIDIKVSDIANFILKCIKKFSFSEEIYNNIIKFYEDISVITEVEKEILYILIKFPRDFYNISKEYYFKEKDWSYDTFLNKFKNKLLNENERNSLLEYIILNK